MKHLTQGNETNLVIESVQGAYQEGENEMEEDCLKNNQPGLQTTKNLRVKTMRGKRLLESILGPSYSMKLRLSTQTMIIISQS